MSNCTCDVGLTNDETREFNKKFPNKFQSTIFVFGDSVSEVSADNVNRIHNQGKNTWEKQSIAHYVSSPEYCQFCDIAGEPVVIKWKTYSDTQNVPDREHASVTVPKVGSSSSRCTSTLTGTRNTVKMSANKFDLRGIL